MFVIPRLFLLPGSDVLAQRVACVDPVAKSRVRDCNSCRARCRHERGRKTWRLDRTGPRCGVRLRLWRNRGNGVLEAELLITVTGLRRKRRVRWNSRPGHRLSERTVTRRYRRAIDVCL